MKAMKFRVENEQHSAAIQEVLFGLGYSWSKGNVIGRVVTAQSSPFLYAYPNGQLTYCCDEDNFERKYSPEHHLFLGKIEETITRTQYVEKPPIGLRPKSVVKALRRKEILEAIARYVEADKPVPTDWLEEFEELNT